MGDGDCGYCNKVLIVFQLKGSRIAVALHNGDGMAPYCPLIEFVAIQGTLTSYPGYCLQNS